MKNLLTLLVLGSTISLNTAAKPRQSVTEHCWKDYTGLIPQEALIAGKTPDGQNTYIGQMTIQNNDRTALEYLPGTITPGKVSIEATYEGKIVRSNKNSNAKILCSKIPARYTWHTNSTIEIDCYYVEVGQEDSAPLHFGRVEYSNQTLIGKVFSDDRGSGNTKYLYVPYGNSVLEFENYATLLYCS